jgi:hypothetical protein
MLKIVQILFGEFLARPDQVALGAPSDGSVDKSG